MSPEGPKEITDSIKGKEDEEVLSGELLDEAFKKVFNPFKVNETVSHVTENREEIGWDAFFLELGKAFDSSVSLVALEKTKGVFRQHTGFDRRDFSHPSVSDSYHEYSKKGFLKLIHEGIKVAERGIELVKDKKVNSTRWQKSFEGGNTDILEKDIKDFNILRAWVEENVKDSPNDMPEEVLWKWNSGRNKSREDAESKRINDELEHIYGW